LHRLSSLASAQAVCLLCEMADIRYQIERKCVGRRTMYWQHSLCSATRGGESYRGSCSNCPTNLHVLLLRYQPGIVRRNCYGCARTHRRLLVFVSPSPLRFPCGVLRSYMGTKNVYASSSQQYSHSRFLQGNGHRGKEWLEVGCR